MNAKGKNIYIYIEENNCRLTQGYSLLYVQAIPISKNAKDEHSNIKIDKGYEQLIYKERRVTNM